MELTPFGWYVVIAAIPSFYWLLKVPTRAVELDALDRVGGSALLALVMGWLLWPLFWAAARKSERLK